MELLYYISPNYKQQLCCSSNNYFGCALLWSVRFESQTYIPKMNLWYVIKDLYLNRTE